MPTVIKTERHCGVCRLPIETRLTIDVWMERRGERKITGKQLMAALETVGITHISLRSIENHFQKHTAKGGNVYIDVSGHPITQAIEALRQGADMAEVRKTFGNDTAVNPNVVRTADQIAAEKHGLVLVGGRTTAAQRLLVSLEERGQLDVASLSPADQARIMSQFAFASLIDRIRAGSEVSLTPDLGLRASNQAAKSDTELDFSQWAAMLRETEEYTKITTEEADDGEDQSEVTAPGDGDSNPDLP